MHAIAGGWTKSGKPDILLKFYTVAVFLFLARCVKLNDIIFFVFPSAAGIYVYSRVEYFMVYRNNNALCVLFKTIINCNIVQNSWLKTPKISCDLANLGKGARGNFGGIRHAVYRYFEIICYQQCVNILIQTSSTGVVNSVFVYSPFACLTAHTAHPVRYNNILHIDPPIIF
jgi:hypothetical protein